MVRRGVTPGETLAPEAAMLAEFGVGRASLREALRILEVQGIVALKPGPGGGPVVTARRVDEFTDMLALQLQIRGVQYRELIESRTAIEPVMARLAASNRSPEAVEALASNCAAAEAMGDSDFAAIAAQWTEFHVLVHEAAGNGVMGVLSASLQRLYQARVVSRELSAGRVVNAEIRAENDHDHREIAAAIAAGDVDRAEALMRHHMGRFAASVEGRHADLMHDVIEWD